MRDYDKSSFGRSVERNVNHEEEQRHSKPGADGCTDRIDGLHGTGWIREDRNRCDEEYQAWPGSERRSQYHVPGEGQESD